MAEKLASNEVVTIQEMVQAPTLEGEASLNLLERNGLLGKAEVLEKVKRLKAMAARTP